VLLNFAGLALCTKKFDELSTFEKLSIKLEKLFLKVSTYEEEKNQGDALNALVKSETVVNKYK